MQVILLRHGTTAGNAQGRYVGWTDAPLCPEGEAAAAQAGTDPARELVYVTPLLRTQQTARILFPNARQIVVPELKEMCFGAFEGRSADEMADDPDYRAWVDGGCLGRCPGGESTEEFCDRVCGRFESLLLSLRDAEPCPAFVVHGGVIMAVMSRFARPAVSFHDAFTLNCCGYLCQADFVPRLQLTEIRRGLGPALL